MHINNFRVGADPELAFLSPPSIVNGQNRRIKLYPKKHLFGWDHGGWVVEPHPDPDISIRAVMKNLRGCLNHLAYAFDDLKWRAGAYVTGDRESGRASVTLGGHVHLDFPRPTAAQINAFDNFHDTLLNLDILPASECRDRVERGGYGSKGDCRYEHGHMEYRSLCSWLFSGKTSMLCMTGIKVAAVDPDSLKTPLTSMTELQNWLENYRLKDDDVRWMFDRGYFESDLQARPDRDVKSVWKLDREQGKEHWMDDAARQALQEEQLRLARQQLDEARVNRERLLNEMSANLVRPVFDVSQTLSGIRSRIRDFTVSNFLSVAGLASVTRRMRIADDRSREVGLGTRYETVAAYLDDWIRQNDI